MTKSGGLRGFPSLLPPSKPKKSPRLIPRRRRSSSGRRFSLSRMMGRENNVQEADADAMPGVPALFAVGPQVAADVSVPSSPLTFKEDILATTASNASAAPLSPLPPPANETTETSVHINSIASVGISKGATVDDAPLTPRILLQNTVAMPQHALETPPFQQAPLVVSAKRNGKEVKNSASQAKRRRRRSFDEIYSDSSDDEDGEDDDLQQLQIPEDLSPGERNKEYWKQCYGTLPNPTCATADNSWSAARVAPAKGCLSVSKPTQQNQQMFFNTSLSVSFLQSPPPNGLPPLPTDEQSSPLFSTPKSSPDEPPVQVKCSHAKHVQFGCAEAMEYDIDAPSAKFTPLPPELAQQRFPLEKCKSQQEQMEEEEEIADTKENSAVLSEWEDDFDDIVAQEDGDEEGESSKKKRSKKKHKHRRKSNDRRRSSSFFSPNNSSSLLSKEDEDVNLESPSTGNSMVVNTMASLTMASPSPPTVPVTRNIDSIFVPKVHNDNSTEHLPFSPVVARRLSVEKRDGSGSSSGSEPMLCFEHAIHDTNTITQPKDHDGSITANNAESKNSSVARLPKIKAVSASALNLCESREHWNAKFVLHELAQMSGNIWNLLHSQPEGQTGDSLPELLQCLPACFCGVIQDSLGRILSKMDTENDDRLENTDELDQIDPVNRHDLELVANHDWAILLFEFLTHLTRQLDCLRKDVEAKCFGIETVVFPVEASLAPSKSHLEQTENAIRELEAAISEEKQKRQQLELQNISTLLKCNRIANHTSGLAAFAMDNMLSPMDFDMSGQNCQATFNHVVEGVQTNHIAYVDGSSENLINLNDSHMHAPIERGHIAAEFHKALLCTSNGCALQKILEPPMDVELSEVISHLSCVTGRIDLAALGLHELSKLYTLRVKTILESGHPVVVVTVDLPRNMSIRAFYRRNDPQSVHLSRPCRFYLEQNGQQMTDPNLLTLAVILTRSSSLEASFDAVSVLCEAALKSSAEHLRSLKE